ncbi:hypothetical protein DZC30_18740 [Comamonas testosteroni]|uniref:Uncharacterized protein n=1 Tax=Comamonas testosteroni TaxID=285 RepID=A0A373FBK1_COMTE|nr:helix-turn-helix domain-containing protein [Comamonas testosteroni]RGE41347.1 hypothetical protein DZC30_18740 [Comamonas testosteroni]
MQAPTQDLCRKYDLILALATIAKPGIQQLQQATDIPLSTLKRQLRHLRNDFGMTIDFQRNAGVHGGGGCYIVSDWGFIDKERFLNYWMLNRPKTAKATP